MVLDVLPQCSYLDLNPNSKSNQHLSPTIILLTQMGHETLRLWGTMVIVRAPRSRTTATLITLDRHRKIWDIIKLIKIAD